MLTTHYTQIIIESIHCTMHHIQIIHCTAHYIEIIIAHPLHHAPYTNLHSPPTVCGGADKSLAWPTSRCCRTETIVSLERGVCSCAELQVFSYYRGWKEACQATRAISTTSRRELSSSFFFLQGKVLKEIHAILIETLGEHASSYVTIKNWVAQFFHLWCASSWMTQNSDHPGDYWWNSWANLGRLPDFS